MFGKKSKEQMPPDVEEKKEKPTPAYLREDYPYKAIGEPITDLDSLNPHKLYEIKCDACELSVRSQGINIKSTYERMMKANGCIGCGNRNLIIREVDMSKMAEVQAARKADTETTIS